MDTDDILEKKIFSWYKLKKDGDERIKQLGPELEKHQKNVTALSAVAITAAGILTFFTGGAMLLLLVAAGAVALGLATNVGSTAVETVVSSKSTKEAKKIGEDIKKAVTEIEEHIGMLINKWQESQTPDDSHEDNVMEQILRAMAKNHDLKINARIKLSNMLKALNSKDAAGHPLKESGRCLTLLSQFVRQTISTATLKKVAKDAGEAAAKGLDTVAASAVFSAIASGAAGLLFSAPDLIRKSISLAQNNFMKKLNQSLTDAAAAMLDSSEQMGEVLGIMSELLKVWSDLKNIIGKPARSYDEKKLLMKYAVNHCRDETARQWLRENLDLESFSKLVDMFNFLEKQINEEKKKNHSDSVDITLVAHGCIDDQMMPASCLLPLYSINDVVLYSPWNCALTAEAAYDIATGNMEPKNRGFYSWCGEAMHRPTKLPNEWNSMKKAGDTKIPNIMLSPLRPEEHGAWEKFEKLEDKYGQPDRNRILIPFIIEETKYRVPFFVVSLALSLVLTFSRFQATLHLAACLGKRQQEMNLDEDALKKQYAYAIDNTGMTSSVHDSSRTKGELYTKLKAVFDKRPSGC